jgi:hypothetical protein
MQIETDDWRDRPLVVCSRLIELAIALSEVATISLDSLLSTLLLHP